VEPNLHTQLDEAWRRGPHHPVRLTLQITGVVRGLDQESVTLEVDGQERTVRLSEITAVSDAFSEP
jgi:hypothetical protein